MPGRVSANSGQTKRTIDFTFRLTGGRGFERVLPTHAPNTFHWRLFVPVYPPCWAAAARLHVHHKESRPGVLGGRQRSAVFCQGRGSSNSRAGPRAHPSGRVSFCRESHELGRCACRCGRNPTQDRHSIERIALQMADRGPGIYTGPFHPCESRRPRFGDCQRGESDRSS